MCLSMLLALLITPTRSACRVRVKKATSAKKISWSSDHNHVNDNMSRADIEVPSLSSVSTAKLCCCHIHQEYFCAADADHKLWQQDHQIEVEGHRGVVQGDAIGRGMAMKRIRMRTNKKLHISNPSTLFVKKRKTTCAARCSYTWSALEERPPALPKACTDRQICDAQWVDAGNGNRKLESRGPFRSQSRQFTDEFTVSCKDECGPESEGVWLGIDIMAPRRSRQCMDESICGGTWVDDGPYCPAEKPALYEEIFNVGACVGTKSSGAGMARQCPEGMLYDGQTYKLDDDVWPDPLTKICSCQGRC